MPLLCKNTVFSQGEVSMKYPLDSIDFLPSLYLNTILFFPFPLLPPLFLLFVPSRPCPCSPELLSFFLSPSTWPSKAEDVLGPDSGLPLSPLPWSSQTPHSRAGRATATDKPAHHPPASLRPPSPGRPAPQRKPCGVPRAPDICLPHFGLSPPLSTHHRPPWNSRDPFLW